MQNERLPMFVDGAGLFLEVGDELPVNYFKIGSNVFPDLAGTFRVSGFYPIDPYENGTPRYLIQGAVSIPGYVGTEPNLGRVYSFDVDGKAWVSVNDTETQYLQGGEKGIVMMGRLSSPRRIGRFRIDSHLGRELVEKYVKRSEEVLGFMEHLNNTQALYRLLD
jgi:hypothetical protein